MVYLELPKHCSVSMLNPHILNVATETQIEHIPVRMLAQLTMPSKVTLTSDVVLALSRAEVELHVLGDKSEKSASLLKLNAPSTSLCLKQYEFVTNESLCVKWYKALMQGKQQAQTEILLRLGSTHSNHIDWQHDCRSNLMLEEARMTKHYWRQLAKYGDLRSFSGRERRPPKDPLNALLSLASVMEASLYKNAIVTQGLDPKLSFIHAVGYSRQSLVYDLKELTQPLVDWFCVQLLRDEILTDEHFDSEQVTGLRLNREGQKVFYRSWFRFAKDHKKEVTKTVKLAKRVLSMEVKPDE